MRPALLRVLAALVLVWVGGRPAVAREPTPQAADPRIDLVERGLVGKFYLAGRPAYLARRAHEILSRSSRQHRRC